MSTAGAALRTTGLSMNMEITIMSRLADTIRTTFEQHLNESVHRFVQIRMPTLFLGLLFECFVV